MRSKDTIKVIGEAITHPGSLSTSIGKPSGLVQTKKPVLKSSAIRTLALPTWRCLIGHIFSKFAAPQHIYESTQKHPRTARPRDQLQRLAPGSCASDADEQSGPG